MIPNQDENQHQIDVVSPHQIDMRSSEQEEISPDEDQPLKTVRPHKKYGKMIVFCEKPFFICLGPDYWCFIPAFVIFAVVAYLIVRFVDNHFPSHFWFRIINYGICGGFLLSYLMVALSNPGIVTQHEIGKDQERKPIKGRKKTCKKCNIIVKPTTRHCFDCDICVEQYDHHCPWTSKCIGKNNLWRFYVFVAMVPIFLFYVFIAFSIVMAKIPRQRHNIRQKDELHK